MSQSINDMIEFMKTNKQKAKKEFENIRYIENKKAQQMTEEQLKSLLPKVQTKEDIYQQMKLRYRNSWKSPGYKNDEFGKPPILRAKVLTEWEYERAQLAERSYKYPKGYKGFKGSIFSREFGEPNQKGLSQPFQKYLEIQNQKHLDFKYRPSKYGKTELDIKLEQIENRNKEPFKYVNTIQSNDFGFDKHATWEKEIKQKSTAKTYNSYKIN